MARTAVQHVPYSLRYGGAATSDTVDFGINFQYESTDAFGFSFWFLPTQGTSTEVIVGNRNGAQTGIELFYGFTAYAFRFVLDDDSGGQLNVRLGSLEEIPLNTWSYIEVTYDGSKSFAGTEMYVNGVAVSKASIVATLGTSIKSGTEFYSGTRGGAGAAFNGGLTDLRVHNAENTAAQALDAYNNGNYYNVEAHWPHTEGSGTTLVDVIGGKNGTISGADWDPFNVPRSKRKAVRQSYNSILIPADTANDGVDFTDNNAYDFTTDMTLQVEFFKAGPTSDGAAQRDLISKWKSGSAPDQAYHIYLDNSDRINFDINLTSAGVTSLEGATALARTPKFFAWNEIVATFSGGTTLTLYLNGKIINKSTVAADSIKVGVGLVTLGAREGQATSAKSCISKARMWGSALTKAQVEDLYYDDTVPSGAVFETLMTEGQGTTVANTGSVGGTGTLQSNAAWSHCVPYQKRFAVRNFVDSITDIGALASYGINPLSNDFSIYLAGKVNSIVGARDYLASIDIGAGAAGEDILSVDTGGINCVTFAMRMTGSSGVASPAVEYGEKFILHMTWEAGVPTGDARLYLNGHLVVLDEDITSADAQGQFRWFAANGGGNTALGMQTAEMGIWNSAITAAQVKEHYYNNFRPSSPLAFYKIDETSGATLNDDVASYDLTVVTPDWTGDPMWAGRTAITSNRTAI